MSESVLYVVATPIGNRGDLSTRAREVLSLVDMIAAEDTRHSAHLLRGLGIDTPLLALHEHNERSRCDSIVQRLQQGENMALIADAGTPLISDPGYHLVRRTRLAGLKVVPIPGPCALTAALCVAGLPTDRFRFEGFLPAREGPRRQRLEGLRQETATLVFYESPHRILDSLRSFAAVLGAERYLVLARELTKTFESIHGDRLEALIPWLEADANRRRGEFVLVVQGAEPPSPGGDELDDDSSRTLDLLLEELPLSRAVALGVKLTGVRRKQLYQEALKRMGGD